jgi:hypothetical protein
MVVFVRIAGCGPKLFVFVPELADLKRAKAAAGTALI